MYILSSVVCRSAVVPAAAAAAAATPAAAAAAALSVECGLLLLGTTLVSHAREPNTKHDETHTKGVSSYGHANELMPTPDISCTDKQYSIHKLGATD